MFHHSFALIIIHLYDVVSEILLCLSSTIQELETVVVRYQNKITSRSI